MYLVRKIVQTVDGRQGKCIENSQATEHNFSGLAGNRLVISSTCENMI